MNFTSLVSRLSSTRFSLKPACRRAARLVAEWGVSLFFVAMATAQVNQYPYFGAAAIWYAPPTAYPVGSGPFSVTPADIDGDGILDLVVPNRDSANLTILRGVGDGTFAATTAPLPAGNCPIFVVASDFNRDSINDLAVINHLCNRLFILLGSGGGAFNSPIIYQTDEEPRSIATGDLNGDGFADLAIANRLSGTVSVFVGRGDGTFLAPVSFSASLNPHAIVVADFNNDQLQDLAVANTGTNSVTLFRNEGVNGGVPGFRSLPDIPAGQGSTALTATDLNGDGRADLVVVDTSANGVSVLLANGPFSFDGARFYATGGSPFQIRSADLNADGRPDVVVANRGSNNVTVLLGNGDGTFARTTHLNSFATGRSPYDVAVGDFNRDGRIDLVTANFVDQSVSVLLAEEPRFADLAVSVRSSVTTAAAGATVTFDLQVSNLGPDPAQNVALRNILPPKLSILSCVVASGAACSQQGSEQRVAFSSINPGATEMVTIAARAGDDVCDGDRLADLAEVTARTGDPFLENNQAGSTVTGVNTPPVIGSLADISVINNQPGSKAGVVVAYPSPTVSDNTAGVRISCSQPSGSVFPVGITTVTCTATDVCGLTATTRFNVSVWDVLLIDDAMGHLFLFDSFTGNYLFRRGDTGEEYRGRGHVRREPCDIHLADDRRADITYNRCLLLGAGIFRPNGVAPVFRINNRYTGNNKL